VAAARRWRPGRALGWAALAALGAGCAGGGAGAASGPAGGLALGDAADALAHAGAPSDGAGAADGAPAADGGAADAGSAAPQAWELPAVQTAAQTGLAPEQVLSLPAGTTAVLLSAWGPPGLWLAFEAVQDGSGAVLVAPGWLERQPYAGVLCASCPLRVAALLPGAPLLPLAPGPLRWRLRALPGPPGAAGGPLEAQTVRVAVAVRPAGAPAASALALDVYLTGAEGLEAAGAARDVRLQGWLARLRALLAPIAVELGEVRLLPLDAAWQVVDLDGPGGGDLGALGAALPAAPDRLRIVLVREIVGSVAGLSGVAGVAGGIPGPLALGGAPRSLVAVAIAPLPSRAGAPVQPDVGRTMAHEALHYLGLFHTSELDYGGLFEPLHDRLGDTPEGASDNLMAFEADATGAALTAQQGMVARANPLLRPAPGAAQGAP
jgi:hypothetical protein